MAQRSTALSIARSINDLSPEMLLIVLQYIFETDLVNPAPGSRNYEKKKNYPRFLGLRLVSHLFNQTVLDTIFSSRSARKKIWGEKHYVPAILLDILANPHHQALTFPSSAVMASDARARVKIDDAGNAAKAMQVSARSTGKKLSVAENKFQQLLLRAGEDGKVWDDIDILKASFDEKQVDCLITFIFGRLWLTMTKYDKASRFLLFFADRLTPAQLTLLAEFFVKCLLNDSIAAKESLQLLYYHDPVIQNDFISAFFSAFESLSTS